MRIGKLGLYGLRPSIRRRTQARVPPRQDRSRWIKRAAPDAHSRRRLSRPQPGHAPGRRHPAHRRPRPPGGVQRAGARALVGGAGGPAGDRPLRRLRRPGVGGPIRDNVEALGKGELFGRTRIHRRDATDLGAKPSGDGDRFDLAFLDPPYGQGLGERALAQLDQGGWLAEGALAVLERGAGEADPVTPAYERLDARTYGAARIYFMRYSGSPD